MQCLRSFFLINTVLSKKNAILIKSLISRNAKVILFNKEFLFSFCDCSCVCVCMYVCVCVCVFWQLISAYYGWRQGSASMWMLWSFFCKKEEPYFDQADFKCKKVISLRLSGGWTSAAKPSLKETMVETGILIEVDISKKIFRKLLLNFLLCFFLFLGDLNTCERGIAKLSFHSLYLSLSLFISLWLSLSLYVLNICLLNYLSPLFFFISFSLWIVWFLWILRQIPYTNFFFFNLLLRNVILLFCIILFIWKQK